MANRVTIVDYGLGNLASILSAFSFLACEPVLTSAKREIARASHLVLPGVGAFRDGMHALQERGLVEPLQDYCNENRPFLGICLGMQMLADKSEEFGHTAGLGIISGQNQRIPRTAADGSVQKVPHIGWGPIQPVVTSRGWQGTIFNNIIDGTPFYFVHSYSVATDDDNARLAVSDYNGYELTAVINRGHVYGTQFHPEKSGPAGLKVLENFLNIRP